MIEKLADAHGSGDLCLAIASFLRGINLASLLMGQLLVSLHLLAEKKQLAYRQMAAFSTAVKLCTYWLNLGTHLSWQNSEPLTRPA